MKTIWEGAGIVLGFSDVQHVETYNENGLLVITRHTRWDREADMWANNVWICAEERDRFLAEWQQYLIGKDKSDAGDKPIITKSKCHVCGGPTDKHCINCEIDLGSQVYVCAKPACEFEHDKVCPSELRTQTASLIKALNPFAAIAEGFALYREGQDLSVGLPQPGGPCDIVVADLRRAEEFVRKSS